jgi:CRP-like cAMP-binding protein
MDLGAALRRATIFEGITDLEVQQLEPSLRQRTFARDAFIFREGDPANAMFVLVSGQVTIGRIGGRGDEVVFDIIKPGESFGELALLEDEPVRVADAQALERAECVAVGKDAFLAFIETHPKATRRLIQLLMRYLQSMDIALAETASLDITGRVAKKLLELAASHGENTDSGIRIRLRLTQRTLAGLVSASRENVNRSLSRFQRQGIITKDGGYITIVHRDRLRRLC